MTQRERMRMALETGFSLMTVTKWDQGKTVAESTGKALTKAAKELGILSQEVES